MGYTPYQNRNLVSVCSKESRATNDALYGDNDWAFRRMTLFMGKALFKMQVLFNPEASGLAIFHGGANQSDSKNAKMKRR